MMKDGPYHDLKKYEKQVVKKHESKWSKNIAKKWKIGAKKSQMSCNRKNAKNHYMNSIF